jgi:hypothetical protein
MSTSLPPTEPSSISLASGLHCADVYETRSNQFKIDCRRLPPRGMQKHLKCTHGGRDLVSRNKQEKSKQSNGEPQGESHQL